MIGEDIYPNLRRNESPMKTAPIALTLAASSLALAGDCSPDWAPAIGQPGLNGYIADFAPGDLGDGEFLYAAGAFTDAGSQVGRWDGSSWSGLAGGGAAGGFSNVLAIYQGELYLGGAFGSVGGVAGTAAVARWNGSAWNTLAGGIDSFIPSVWSMAVYDGRLLVGGNFTEFGGVADTNYVAAWDGAAWSDLGGGLTGQAGLANALAMTVYDGDLYVGGRFSGAGGATVSQIARWDGSQWSDVGGGITGTQVLAMTVHDDGAGPALYVAGNFTAAGGAPARSVAKWDGTSWSAVGSGFASNVNDIISFDDGDGPDLYVAGTFSQSVAGARINRLARFNGTAWEDVGGGLSGGNAFGLGVWDDGAGASLFVGGSFTTAGTIVANSVAQWRGCESASCPGDVSGDGVVGAEDLAALIAAWGTPAGDLDGDDDTGASDLAALVAAWGPCF